MALMSVNSDQTAQRPGRAQLLGYKYCAVCLGAHTPPPMVVRCEETINSYWLLPDDFELQLHYRDRLG